MNASGTGALQASAGSEAIGYPSWNPNSTMVAYWSMNGQESEISLYNVTSNSTMVLPGSAPTAVQSDLAWSPDGTHLAFFVGSSASQLFVYDLSAGTSAAVANASGSYLAASWASNDHLLYSTYDGGYQQINWLNPATGAGGLLIGGGANFTDPVVGPNGTISYYSDLNPAAFSEYQMGYGGFNVWVANPDGSNATFQYVNALQNEGGPLVVQIPYIPGTIDASNRPAWSPDGTLVVYTASASGTGSTMYEWDIAAAATTIIGPYGAGIDSIEPCWNPIGGSIAFSSDIGGNYHIWVLSVTGNLTSSLVGY
jgi:Tol biopolymer transport system component